jgi:hypothetical protein
VEKLSDRPRLILQVLDRRLADHAQLLLRDGLLVGFGNERALRLFLNGLVEFFDHDGARGVAGAEAGNARFTLEIIGHLIVSLLDPVGRDFNFQAFLARGDVFYGDIHGTFQTKSASD